MTYKPGLIEKACDRWAPFVFGVQIAVFLIFLSSFAALVVSVFAG